MSHFLTKNAGMTQESAEAFNKSRRKLKAVEGDDIAELIDLLEMTIRINEEIPKKAKEAVFSITQAAMNQIHAHSDNLLEEIRADIVKELARANDLEREKHLCTKIKWGVLGLSFAFVTVSFSGYMIVHRPVYLMMWLTVLIWAIFAVITDLKN